MQLSDRLLDCVRTKDGYGSAMDMLSRLSGEAKGFKYDEPLPFGFGEVRVDGFMEQDDRYVITLAALSELYTELRYTPDSAHIELYRFISDNTYGSLSCEITDTDVSFNCYGDAVKRFSLVKTIDYMLGIAYALLTGRFEKKNIDFMYLVYNPDELDMDKSLKDKATEIYERLCEECNALELSTLFTVILVYLRDIKGVGEMTDGEIEMLGYNFTVYLCDQELYPNLLV